MKTGQTEVAFTISNDPLLDGLPEQNGLHLLGKVLRTAGRAATQSGVAVPCPRRLMMRLHHPPAYGVTCSGILHSDLLEDGSLVQRIEITDTLSVPTMSVRIHWSEKAADEHESHPHSVLKPALGFVEWDDSDLPDPPKTSDLRSNRMVHVSQRDAARQVPLAVLLRWFMDDMPGVLENSSQLKSMQIELDTPCADGDQLMLRRASSVNQRRSIVLQQLAHADSLRPVIHMLTSWQMAQKASERSRHPARKEVEAS